MDLLSFISMLVEFLLKGLANIQDFLNFLVDFPGLIVSTISTFPSFVIAGFTTISVFLVIGIIFKLYRDLH